ncbi:hypothetical protein [Deinococcus aerophilus]|uniref:Uncharacterized protein n=1 Tax=Deinococcus aerophilus TaxID=522488 RepID=A0ABQ2GIA3_9DEIO|nr:hypothetical protein [Deinococcus aerophilus]GGL97687.1 hypothetical protein GCM10010841_02550 [Deinococcus aerophilus]
MTGPKKGSRGRAPKRNTAQGRGGSTRDTEQPARERTTSRGSEVERAGGQDTRKPGARGARTAGDTERRPAGSRSSAGTGRSATGKAATNPARRGPGEGERGQRDEKAAGERSFKPAAGRKPPPRVGRGKPMPELKRVQLDAPPPDAVFRDRDGERLSFPDSNLKRVAAAILSEKRKAWRYRPFSFPLFTDSGNEQAFHFDFYIYDAEDSVIRLLLVIPFESREVWDRVGRFKRQYPMYTYELWTPEKLAKLSGPRGHLDF